MPIGTSSGHRRLAARAAMAQIGAVGAALSPMSTTGTHVTGRDAKIMARLSAPKTSDHANIIQLKVTLRRVKPPVWRRLLMPGTMNLGELHTAIQAAMGWDDCHLHVFDIGGESFGDRRSVDDVADEKRPTLNGLLRSSVIRFSYTYDFGDNWEHTIAFEKSELAVEGGSYPGLYRRKAQLSTGRLRWSLGVPATVGHPGRSRPPRTCRPDRLDRRRIRTERVQCRTR